MSREYRPLNGILFESIFDGRLEKHGIKVTGLRHHSVARLVDLNGTLTASREGLSTRFECALNVNAESILSALKLEFDTEIVHEDDPRFWGFATEQEMIASHCKENRREGRTGHSTQWVLVEGPCCGDADFIMRWLRSAIEADELLQSYFSANPSFRKEISRLAAIVQFAQAAMAFLRFWAKDGSSFAFDLFDSELAEIFVTMVDAGFFKLTGERYQMTVPASLDVSQIADSLLGLAQTEDREYLLHPEKFVTMLSFQEAFIWQDRLARMNGLQRVADREALLSD